MTNKIGFNWYFSLLRLAKIADMQFGCDSERANAYLLSMVSYVCSVEISHFERSDKMVICMLYSLAFSDVLWCGLRITTYFINAIFFPNMHRYHYIPWLLFLV